jgi:hypothetical protein
MAQKQVNDNGMIMIHKSVKKLITTSWMQNNAYTFISNDNSYKNTNETICRTISVRSIMFGILCSIVVLKIQSQPNGLWSTQQHQFQNVFKIMIQTILIKRSMQSTICKPKNKREIYIERVTRICLGSSLIDIAMGTFALNSNSNWCIILYLTYKMCVYKRWRNWI